MFTTILLLLFIFFVVIPLGRIALGSYRVYRQFRRATAGLRGEGRQHSQRREPPRPKRRKKIDPDVGEYVAYEEIHTAASATAATDGSTATFTAESQVEDAEWEEL